MKTLYKDAAGKYYEKDARDGDDFLYIELYDVSKEYSLPRGCVFREYGVGGWSTDKTFVSELQSTKEKVKEVLVEYGCESERLYINISQLYHFLTEVFLYNKQDLKTLIKLSKRYGYILNALLGYNMEELKKYIEHRIGYLRKKNAQAIDLADDINDPYFDYIEGQIRALGDVLYMLEGK